MKQTRDILIQLEGKFSDIEYYNIIIDIIEVNVEKNPDIAIDACKSFVEGISKFILKQLDASYNSTVIDGLKYQELFKKSLSRLSRDCDLFEEDFIKRTGSIIHLLGEIRNERGDISHGKLAPKQYYSDVSFSHLVMSITDGVIFYILRCFMSIPKERKIIYEDYSDFNEQLDGANPLGFLSYSKALFEQEPITYKEELKDYLDSNETLAKDA